MPVSRWEALNIARQGSALDNAINQIADYKGNEEGLIFEAWSEGYLESHARNALELHEEAVRFWKKVLKAARKA